jgi:magnesium-transporting ATPase (P-type)
MTARVIDGAMWSGVVFVGLVMAAVTLLTIDLGLPGGLIEGAGPLDRARTMGFTVLVLAQLFNAFNSRSDIESALPRFFTNRRLFGAIGLSLVLQVAVIHLPFLNHAFSTTPLSPGDWAICVTVASVVLVADEARKLVLRAARR